MKTTDFPTKHEAPTGELLKTNAHAVLEANRPYWILRGRRLLLKRLLADGRATIDDVHDELALPESINPTVCGAIPGLLARRKIIEVDDYKRTNRPKAHSRMVTVWKLRDRGAAVSWLAANPLPAEESEAGG